MADSATAVANAKDMDIHDFLKSKSQFVPDDYKTLHGLACATESNRSRLFDHVGHLKKESGRNLEVGILSWILRDYKTAKEMLGQAGNSETGALYYAKTLTSLGELKQAIEYLKKSVASFPKNPDLFLDLGELYAIDENGSALETLVTAGQSDLRKTAEWNYLKGRLEELRTRVNDARDAYEAAHKIQPKLICNNFRLGRLCDLQGEDERAISLYETCLNTQPIQIGAVMNLGVLYEDHGRFDDAARCFKRVLQAQPGHLRARLFLKDAEASKYMFYDEEIEKKQDKQKAILQIPVTDFELSVRSRNCLSKMNIRSLGDLIRKTEAELLSFKNFGETSLNEIKEMLHSKGLRLGMAKEEEDERRKAEQAERLAAAGGDAVLNKTLAELELSVRSRKCVERLGLKSLGDLSSKSEAELLSVRNFGQSSINELRKILADFGLTFRH